MRSSWAGNRGAFFAAVLLLGVASAADAQTGLGAQGEPKGELREQSFLIPLPHADNAPMYATVYRPPGAGRFPLVVINHGSPGSPAARPTLKSVFKSPSTWFVERGFAVVLPVRRGYGATGGEWAENYGRCDSPDFRRAGLETAKDIEAAIGFMTRQDFVQPERAIVVGQSAGGWGSIALASRNPATVALIINFAGGRGGFNGGKPNSNCRSDKLIEAAGEFGKSARTPMLWIYSDNDLFFSPGIARQMFDAFRARGGVAEFHALGPFGKDGHAVFGASNGLVRWKPAVDKFLVANGR